MGLECLPNAWGNPIFPPPAGGKKMSAPGWKGKEKKREKKVSLDVASQKPCEAGLTRVLFSLTLRTDNRSTTGPFWEG